MAFLVTSYKSFSLASFEPVTQQFHQITKMTITRGASDATLDIGNPTGTFWTSALTGSPTIGVAAQAHFKNLVSKAQDISALRIPEVTDTRTPIYTGSPATGQYKLATSSLGALRLDLFATDAAPGTLSVVVTVVLMPGELPVPSLSL